MKKSFLLACALVGLIYGCESESGQQTVTGNGVTKTITRESESFTQVETTGDMTVMYLKGSTPSVKITCDENLADYIETSVSSKSISIGPKSGVVLTSKNVIRVTITAPSLTSIDLLGSGVVSADEMTGQDVSVTINGAGKLTVGNVTATNLTLNVFGRSSVILGGTYTNISTNISGDGSVVLTGTNTQKHDLTIEGTGHAQCYDLKSNNATVTLTGNCTAELSVAKALSVDAGKRATLYYKGHPTITQNLHGTANLVDSN